MKPRLHNILRLKFAAHALGPIDIHCVQIIATARWMKPVKLSVRLSQRVAELAEAALDAVALLVGIGVVRNDYFTGAV